MDFKSLQLREAGGNCTIPLKVIPKSSRDEIAGVEAGALKLKIRALPVEGEANEAVLRFLAKWFGRPRVSVEMVRGQKSRQKVVRIRGLKTAEVLAALSKQEHL